MKSYFVLLLSLFLCFNLSAKDKYVVTVDVLNVRKEASATSLSIATIHKGDTIKVNYSYNGWSMFYMDMQRGWVASKYIKKIHKPRKIHKVTSTGFLLRKEGNVIPKGFDRYVLDLTSYSFGIDQKTLAYIIGFLGILIAFFFLSDSIYNDRIYELILLLNSVLLVYYFLAMPNPFWFLNDLPWYKAILSFILFVLYSICVLFCKVAFLGEEFDEKEDFSFSPILWFTGSLVGLITAFYTSKIWLLLGLAIIVGVTVFDAIKLFKHKNIFKGIYQLVFYLFCNFASTIIALFLVIPVLVYAIIKITGIISHLPSILSAASDSSDSSSSGSNEANEEADNSASITIGGNKVKLEEGSNGRLHGDNGKDYEYTSPFKDKVREID